jgi:hypothetical protein
MTPPIPTPTVAEKEAALGRLTASHALTVANANAGLSGGMDTMEALRVLGARYGADKAAGLLQKCIAKLQTSDLTININSTVFFSAPVTNSQYGNCWQRQLGSGQRNDVERRLLDYGGANTPTSKWVFPKALNTTSATRDDQNARLQKVTSEIKARGDLGDLGALRSSGYAGMRPKYAGVNFTGYPNGAAAVDAYGKSCLILKNVLRFNATYTAEDSFGLPKIVSLAPYVATYLNLAPLIRYANTGLLDVLVSSTQLTYRPPKSLPTRSDDPSQVLYFEAQLHCDINFSRDVELLVISQSELNGLADADVRKQVKHNIKDFVKTFKIPVKTI